MLVLRLPVGFVLATARVVHVVRSAERVGFAFGTLPSHPEEGEEIFLVRPSDGRVSFEVAAFSRPTDPLARLGAPVTRWLQLRTNRPTSKRSAGSRRSAANHISEEHVEPAAGRV